jgi:glycosyltransferase involved in cell wall biosynthesis
MSRRVLHLVDATTSGDALEILGQLCARISGEHVIASLGHRGTAKRARWAGISIGTCGPGILGLPSVGWADPAGWRGVRRLVRQINPTHLHAWGISAVVAASMAKFARHKRATFADLPQARQMRILRWADRRNMFTWIVTSATLRDQFAAAGFDSSRIRIIRPGIDPSQNAPSTGSAALRHRLGIQPQDGPVFLLGGEGPRARADHGIWAAAIVQQILPRTRIILHQNPCDGSVPGLDRFFNLLPDETLLAVAPASVSWNDLLAAADLLLIAADGTIPTASILRAMQGRVPVIATPIPAVTELIEHGRIGIIAGAARPRFLAACAHEFLTTPALKAPLVEAAQAEVRKNFPTATMLAAYESLA